MFSIRSLSLLLLLSISMQSAFASNVLGESIYFLELLVIAIVALALILVTSSIAKSRESVRRVASDIREEMIQERTMLQMTMSNMKEKEKEITYMAHLLQKHLESDSQTESVKKKHEELIIEVIDDSSDWLVTNDTVDHHNISNKNHDESSSSIDPRKVSADGSIKRSHFGADRYLDEIQSYQQHTHERLQERVAQTNNELSRCIDNLQTEMEKIQSERVKLGDYVVTIESNINLNTPQHMNVKDKRIVNALNDVDKKLHAIEKKQKNLIKRYSYSILRFEDYIGVDEVMVDVEVEMS